jgi:hypothetical protein
MQAFSSTVRDLYALAEYASPDQFLTRAIGLMQMWIRFDGAIFGTGERSEQQTLCVLESDPIAEGATVPETLQARAQFRDDPVARGFREAPMSPSRGGIRELYRKSRDGKKSKLTQFTGVRSLPRSLACPI